MARSVNVGSLLARIARRGRDPTERLRALTQLRRELDSLETELAADALRAGRTWREIGAALGVSKQAAHRRHSHDVAQLDRAAETDYAGAHLIVSEEVRTAVRMARREAASAGDQAFGTGHLLLGVLQCGDEAAVAVLDRVGLTLRAARQAMHPTAELSAGAAAAVNGNGRVNGDGPPAAASPRARRTLARALTESSGHSSDSLTAIDLLRALLRDESGGAAQTLDSLGIDPGRVRAEIERSAPGAQRLR
ncbi:MAG TPA: Clp protease N-terminal domain-containing protein [Solirubrobacteraceae bacterium]|jgi:ATP-dependent Clp protease ATP-binding subunit ClpA|nr:Clp protease N-terminal domain-containing protein [Solirubrobacteraceae bacterium]